MLVGFLQSGTANVIWGTIACVVAFVVATVVTYLFGFTKEQLDADKQAAEAQKLAA